MYQCILNVPLWNNWSKVTYSQVHGSPVRRTLLLQSFWWIFAARFTELIQFWQDPKCRRSRTFWRKKIYCFIGERFHIIYILSVMQTTQNDLSPLFYILIHWSMYQMSQKFKIDMSFDVWNHVFLNSKLERRVKQRNSPFKKKFHHLKLKLYLF